MSTEPESDPAPAHGSVPHTASDTAERPRRHRQTQTMKPETAAKKLGILLEAAPEELRSAPVSREQLDAWNAEPPAWLEKLRADGPHPRQVVAGKLGVSTSGLARAGITDPLTTEEIKALLVSPPAWLVAERATQAEVRAEQVGSRSATPIGRPGDPRRSADADSARSLLQ